MANSDECLIAVFARARAFSRVLVCLGSQVGHHCENIENLFVQVTKSASSFTNILSFLVVMLLLFSIDSEIRNIEIAKLRIFQIGVAPQEMHHSCIIPKAHSSHASHRNNFHEKTPTAFKHIADIEHWAYPYLCLRTTASYELSGDASASCCPFRKEVE